MMEIFFVGLWVWREIDIYCCLPIKNSILTSLHILWWQSSNALIKDAFVIKPPRSGRPDIRDYKSNKGEMKADIVKLGCSTSQQPEATCHMVMQHWAMYATPLPTTSSPSPPSPPLLSLPLLAALRQEREAGKGKGSPWDPSSKTVRVMEWGRWMGTHGEVLANPSWITWGSQANNPIVKKWYGYWKGISFNVKGRNTLKKKEY